MVLVTGVEPARPRWAPRSKRDMATISSHQLAGPPGIEPGFGGLEPPIFPEVDLFQVLRKEIH